jgi:hypothetical protein
LFSINSPDYEGVALAIDCGGEVMIKKSCLNEICGTIVVLFAVQFILLFPTPDSAYSKQEGITIENLQKGKAEIINDKGEYFYVKGKIKVKEKTALVLKQKSCILIGADGKEYSDCWIMVSGASSGVSVSKSAPISMKTLSIKTKDGKDSSAHEWNTAKVDGPNGFLDFGLPIDGFVDLNFLWPVPNNFKPKKFKIGDLIEENF